MQKARLVSEQLKVFSLALLCGCVAPCVAQPVMSRGQQQLSINYSECLNRARQALKTVGFTVAGAGNDAQGFKEASGAYIICNDAPSGGMMVNIVVATIADDAGVPGSLRQLLQAQMEKPGSATPPGTGGKWSWEAIGVRDCSGHDTSDSSGSAPDASKANGGLIAICWDGKTHNNSFARSGQAWCTYKNIPASECKGGNNLGVLYQAVQR
jgi:hypothetical protein